MYDMHNERPSIMHDDTMLAPNNKRVRLKTHLGVISDVAVHDREVHEVRVFRGANIGRDRGHRSAATAAAAAPARPAEFSQLPEKLHDVLEIRPECIPGPPHLFRDSLRSVLLLQADKGRHPLEQDSAQEVGVVAVVHGGRVRTHEKAARQHPVGFHGRAQVLARLLDGRERLEAREGVGLAEHLREGGRTDVREGAVPFGVGRVLCFFSFRVSGSLVRYLVSAFHHFFIFRGYYDDVSNSAGGRVYATHALSLSGRLEYVA